MNLLEFETIIPLTLAAISFAGFVNAVFVCFFGIRFMDKYLSKLQDYRRESSSPFDRFERMHKYSFGRALATKDLHIGLPMRLWLRLTALGLSAYWFVFTAGALAYFFDADPIAIIFFGIAHSR